jgi:glycine cleavage system H protein
MNPEELKFAKTHEWVSISENEGQTIATVGISAFAVEALTDLVYIELPEVGRKVDMDESFCEVESVKAVSDVYAPVAGTVVDVNETLPDTLETLSSDPYGDGWIAKIELSDGATVDDLLDFESYQKQCEEEAH